MDGLKILSYDNEGYDATFTFDKWIVAFINYAERFDPKGLTYLERHNESDEVFILTQGSATMLIGETGERVEMEKNKIYAVEKGQWHGIVVSKDAKVIVVENSNTSKENSDYMPFSMV